MPTLAFIGGVSPWNLAIILLIVLILFGAGRLPEVFSALGKGVKAFRDGQRDDVLDVSPKISQDLHPEAETERERDPANRSTPS